MNYKESEKKLVLIFKENLLCKNDNYFFCYRKGKIVLKDTKSYATIQTLRIHPVFMSFSILERVFRLVPRCAFALNEQEFIYSDHGSIFRYSIKTNSVVKEHTFSKGMSNPLSFCIRRDLNNAIIDVLYGEYIQNDEKGPVAIYKRDNGIWLKVFEFPSNTIKHIHNIIFDKENERYIILTGDNNNESAIWLATINFANVEPIVIGKQKYRACIGYVKSNEIYYATDTPLEQNYLYKLKMDGSVQEICKLPGPCIFGIKKEKYLYIATSVEGNPVLPKWEYMLSSKIGPGLKDRYVHIFRIKENYAHEEILCIKKDFLPMGLFQFGNIIFPSTNDESLYFVPQALVIRNGTYILGLNDE